MNGMSNSWRSCAMATAKRGLSLLIGIFVMAAGAPDAAWAQDTPGTALRAGKVVLTRSGPRTSPFDPPEKDVFLTDASPGLDTGCVFNTNPLNPLTVDIAVDRFVGDVDANGLLVNPAALISAGIVPASVDIILPAYDVDFNGAAPPERDEVLFNGQSLGFLTGDNNVWKLNNFRVDIRKLKFPARPAAGGAVVPVNNRLQIRIDTLSSGRWCTQVDWVALVVPIRPKLALDLEVLSGNPVRVDSGASRITQIQQQRFDANCNLTTTSTGLPADIEQYPFSGPARSFIFFTGSAKLKAKIRTCPEGSLTTPAVTADWEVAGTTRKGQLNWSGLDGEVEYQMPEKVGAYDATLKLTLDNGQTIDATRRLYVTRRPPRSLANASGEPILNYYKQGTAWAAGESDEDPIVTKVRRGLYAYGGTRWKYGYVDLGNGNSGWCSWDQLMANPITCNFSDCYVFSDVLENISGTLGVGGFDDVPVYGSHSQDFLTSAAPSIDPNFPGSARPVGGGGYDRYVFSSHSLRERSGVYHDSTFNKGYGGERDFIVANFTGSFNNDLIGTYFETDEGPRLYLLPGNSYRTWGNWAYLLNPPRPALRGPLAAGQGSMVRTAAGVPARIDGLNFVGVSQWQTPDTNVDGRFDALVAQVDLDIVQAGAYVVAGQLLASDGRVVATRPNFQSSQSTSAQVLGAPGRRTIALRFSGEQIRRASIDGPWRLVLFANGDGQPGGRAEFQTPGYSPSQFGETLARVSSLTATPLDTDGSGRYDTIRVEYALDVVQAGPLQVALNLSGQQGADLASDSRLFAATAGVQTLQADLPVTALARSGIDGPYRLVLALRDARGSAIESRSLTLSGLTASQFEPVVGIGANLIEQRIDSNGNQLIDLLRVQADLQVRSTRPAVVRATLTAINGASVAVERVLNLAPGPAQRVAFDFTGPQIRALRMDSAYRMELSFRSPTTLAEFDAAAAPLRDVYLHTQFDPAQPPTAIALNGTRSDRGIDTNGNGRFERLQVDLGVDLLQSDTYEWSARLVDRNGQELGFATGSGALTPGARTIRLEFNGVPIGQNGLNGPYMVRSLLMAGRNGANLVATFAGETSAWQANQFEGFTVRAPGDLNGDGRVDAADIEAFNRALGSSLGEPNYNRFADFDRDGRVTLNDLRLFRSYLPRS